MPVTEPEEKLSSPTHKRRVTFSDILITVIILALIVFLVRLLFAQLGLRHEVQAARSTTDQLITAMQKQDAYSARKLGDSVFQTEHSTSELSYLFDQAKNYTKGTPAVVKQTVNNGTVNRVVSVYYRFDAKQPFYVRVTVVEPNNTTTWLLINFSGNASLSTLTK